MSRNDTPANIPARYLEALGGEDPLRIQKSAPKRAKKLLKGKSEKELARKPAPDRWSMKEVIAHLADHEIVYGYRVRCIAALDAPLLERYDQQRFLDRLGTERAKTKDLLDAWAAVRAANHALIERLPREALDRVGIHAERGEESLRGIVIRNAGHDAIHLAQLERTRDALRTKGSKKTVQKAARKSRRSKAK